METGCCFLPSVTSFWTWPARTLRGNTNRSPTPFELIADSSTGWEDAASSGLADGCKTLRGIRSMYIKDSEAKVRNNKVVAYRVIAEVSFLVEAARQT